MGITQFTTSVTLTTGVSTPDDGTVVVVGMPVWFVSYTKERKGHAEHFRVMHYSEVGARRMVKNLLQDIPPGVSVEDVYSEQVG